MLSLSMIVRDEAERLEGCLQSVQGVVDEMVVVDTGSRDATVAIARAAGATVHTIAWPGDFAPARNQALQWVHGDWVLVLDADERLRPEVVPALRALMAEPDLLLINLIRVELGARQSPYSSVSRLFRRHPELAWSRPYHSMVDDSVRALIEREPHWRVADCPEPALLHDGYSPEQLADGAKAARLRDAMQAELQQTPADPYASAKLAGLEISAGRIQQALELIRAALEHCPRERSSERYELLFHRGLALAERDPAAAAASYAEAIDLPVPARVSVGARLNLTALLLRNGDSRQAMAIAEETSRVAPDLGLAWFNLGLIRRQAGDLSGATAAYTRAAACDPEHAETHQNLAVAQLLSGEIQGARRGFATAIALLEAQGRNGEAHALRQRLEGLVKVAP
ncbi:glycosyltransferase [Synechococcus sp. RSCCF101]|uniref:glycosyltransferase n=1 Tax=Synechococcus sp. RSCCF101 TaxID=2511069 RepID=UPI001243B7BC|nr:glycosyltransferase [Synechococcus sp. RSCCF101]QEY32917.1 glycosyltransferase [Synechococcus sp. RSCCF101]